MEKFNNHGLDVINSRVCFALDDYEDSEEIQGQTNSKVKNISNIQEWLYNKEISTGDLSTSPLKNFNGISEFINTFLPEDISRDYVDYIYGIIAVGDRNGYGNIEQEAKVILKDEPSTDYWMFSLARLIHVYLKEPKEMPKPPISGEYSTESLGCYIPSSQENYPYPVIYLCPERIKNAADRLEIDKKVLLFAKVLIHELAHAIMDPTNIFENGTLKPKVSKQKLVSDADVFMEESLPNMITLQYFEAAKSIIGENDFERVKSFMKIQPDAYNFGITQYEKLHTDWREWRKNKSQMAFWNYWAGIVSRLSQNTIDSILSR